MPDPTVPPLPFCALVSAGGVVTEARPFRGKVRALAFCNVKQIQLQRTTSCAASTTPLEPAKLDSTHTGLDEISSADVKALQQEILDLKITNRGKDYFIDQLQKEREGFGEERQRYVEELMQFNRRVGELELQLKQIDGPKHAQTG